VRVRVLMSNIRSPTMVSRKRHMLLDSHGSLSFHASLLQIGLQTAPRPRRVEQASPL
jgi:hypothetical protein